MKHGNQVVFITGISRGLGADLASYSLCQGFSVVGIGRTRNPKLEGPTYSFIEIDLSEPSSITPAFESMLAEIRDTKPSSVCLVNNAATSNPVGTMGAVDLAAIHHGLTVNLLTPLFLCSLFTRMFKNEPYPSRIINVSSGAATSPISGNGPYCIAKAGIEMLTRVVALDCKGTLLSCVGVRPGVIDTDMQTEMRNYAPEVLPSVGMFKKFHDDGVLRKSEEVANVLFNKLIANPVETGRIYDIKEILNEP